MQILKEQSRLMLVIWGMLATTFLAALGLGRWSLAFVALATFALSLAPVLLASRLRIQLPLSFLAATSLFVFASIFMGEAFDFYERFWWWDLALHGSSAVGFGLIGFLFVFMLFEGDRFAAPPSAMAFITFCLAMTVGSIWEVFEYLMDQSFGLNMQKSGLDDTMGDLMVDAAGASIAALSGFLYLRGQSSGLLGRAIVQFIALNRRLYAKSRDRLRK